MRVLLAFDKFKDSLAAEDACAAAAQALRETHPDWSLDLCPLADGGEGFARILTRAAGGVMTTLTVTGPRGAPVEAGFGLVPLQQIPAAARALLALPDEATALPGNVAVIEMAAASGLALLAQNERDPWHTTTRGTGELIRAAIERRACAIVVGVGGSATNDLGFGALSALGYEFLDEAGQRLDPLVPAAWSRLTRISGGPGTTLPPIRIACDVTNPLLGPKGAAAIYGPQKGLLPADHRRMEHESARLGLLLCNHCRQPDTLMNQPGAGAAGGIAFGLMTAAGAKLLPGFDLVSAWLDLDSRIAAADVVITGEGRFDESSLSGKGPGAVATQALLRRKTVHVFAGQVTATQPPPNLHLHAITPVGLPLAEALRTASTLLATSVRSAELR